MTDSNQIPDDPAAEALRTHLERRPKEGSARGWRSVFGKARREEVESIDALIDEEFKSVKSDEER